MSAWVALLLLWGEASGLGSPGQGWGPAGRAAGLTRAPPQVSP